MQIRHTLFISELEYSGLFQIKDIDGEPLKQLLSIQVPNKIYPHAICLMSQITQEGGLVPLSLRPINFAAMYQLRLEKAKGQLHKLAKLPTDEVLPAKKMQQTA